MNGLKVIYRFIRDLLWKIKNIPNAIANAQKETYNPEHQRKSEMVRIWENICWLFKYREVNDFYNLYGLDIKNSNLDEYQDYYGFMVSRNIINKAGKLDSQQVLLRNKFLFYKIMKSYNAPVPEVFGLIKDGKIYDVFMNEQVEDSFLCGRKNYFIKDIDGECASFVKRVTDYEEYLQIKAQLAKGEFILQEAIYQSDEMNRINPKAINTLRVVTVNEAGKIKVLTALLRVGTEKTGNVDNWAQGGLAVGINENGYLKEYGYYKPKFGTKTNIHPDTKVKFSEFQIPDYEEVLKLACKVHTFFYGLNAIGWDIALTDDGIMFIEGNDNWEISLMQVCDRPLAEEWEKVIN